MFSDCTCKLFASLRADSDSFLLANHNYQCLMLLTHRFMVGFVIQDSWGENMGTAVGDGGEFILMTY